jgi:hypothetical protein
MGWSLQRVFNDIVHPGQGNNNNQNNRPAVTPPPGTNLRNLQAPQQQAPQIPGVQAPHLTFGTPQAPAFHVAPPTPIQAPPAPGVPATATKVYHDNSGNVTGWEDPTGSHLTPTGQAAQAKSNGDTRSLRSKLWDQINPADSGRSFSQDSTTKQNDSVIHAITHNGITNTAGNVIAKPIVNTVTGDIVEPSRSIIAEATGNKQAQAAADARAQADQAASLPQMIVKPFAKTAYGLGNVPDALRGEFDAMSSDPTIRQSGIDRTTRAQKRVFGTTDSGEIAKQIAGNTAAEIAMVAAPSVAGAATDVVSPYAAALLGADVSTPATEAAIQATLGYGSKEVAPTLESAAAQRLLTGGIESAAGAPQGAAINTGMVYGDHPNVTAKEAEAAAIQGGELGAGFGFAGGALRTPVDPNAPKIIQVAQEAKNAQAAAKTAPPNADVVAKQADPVDQLLSDGKKKVAALDTQMAKSDALMNELDGIQGTKNVENLNQTPADVGNIETPKATPKKTGVSDPLVQQIEQARKSAVGSVADEIRQAQERQPGVYDQMGRNSVYVGKGGLPEDYQSLPKFMRSLDPNKQALDEWATNLGFHSEDDLLQAIQDNAPRKGMTKAEALVEAEKQLTSGSHPMSGAFKQIDDALKARQDELSQYPKGTKAQVKVNTKAPAAMDQGEFESLMNTPEGRASLTTKKIPTIDPKAEVRNPDAERTVLNSLNKGTSNDTILEQYMKDTGTTLQKAVKDVSRVAKEANIETGLGKNPLLAEGAKNAPQDLPTVGEGDYKQATLNSRFVQSKEQELGSHALQDYRSLSAHDQMLLKDIEQNTVTKVAKTAEDPAAFKQAQESLRNYFDTRHAYDTKLGLDVGYRTNYIRHFFDKVAEEGDIVPTGDEQLHGGGANKTPGYTKARTIESQAKDVGDALERDIMGSSFNHAKLAYEKGLNEAFPGKIANGEIPRSGNDGKYVQIQHPFGNDLSAPKDIAREINSRTWQPNDSKILDTYDKVNRGLKYVKLSGGLFHAFTESGNFVGQQIASGKLFTDPAATGRLAKVFFSDDAMHHELSRMADDGVLDKAHLGGLTIRSKDILADANIKGLDKTDPNALGGAGEKAAKYTGIQAMHDATFQREIPYAKLKIFEQKTQGLDPTVPADLAKIRQQADSINNLFGGINREVQGIKPANFRWLQRGLLATDFTEGKFATLFKAANLKDGSAAATTARQAVLGKALLFGVLASAGAAAGGDYKGKSAKQVATDAAGNLIDPSFEMGGYKVGLPKTHISEVVDAVKPTNKTGKAWNASGLLSYVQNRSAALPSEAIQLLSNKNYYDQPLYGTNTKKNGGSKISAPQAGLNVAQTVLPIPFGQATNTVTGKQAPAAAVANVIGFKAKPNPDNTQNLNGVNVTLNDKQSEAYQTALKSNTDTLTKQLTSSDAYKNAKPNDQATMLSQLKSNITSATARDFSSKNNLGEYDPSYKGNQSQASAKEQDILSGTINPDAYVPKSGNTDTAAVAAFKKSSDKTKEIGGKTYYKAGDGTVKSTDTFTYNNAQDSARLSYQLDRFKTNDNYSAWKAAANQKLDQLQSEANHYDPVTEADKLYALQKQAMSIQDDMTKYDGYGGQFTKPKSGSSRGKSSNGISYKLFNPSSYEKSLRSLLDAARV